MASYSKVHKAERYRDTLAAQCQDLTRNLRAIQQQRQELQRWVGTPETVETLKHLRAKETNVRDARDRAS